MVVAHHQTITTASACAYNEKKNSIHELDEEKNTPLHGILHERD